MSKGRQTCRDVLAMILCGEDPAWRAAKTRVVSLHTADPKDGDQSTHEAVFQNYQRRSVLAEGFWIRNDLGGYTNAYPITFAMCAGSYAPAITHVGVGLDAEGRGQLLYVGKLIEPIHVFVDDVVRIPPLSLNFLET